MSGTAPDVVPDDQIPRFARLGVAAWADHRVEWSAGPERAAGATMVLGSDWPVPPTTRGGYPPTALEPTSR